MRRPGLVLILLAAILPAMAAEGGDGGKGKGEETRSAPAPETTSGTENAVRALTRILGEEESGKDPASGPADPREPDAPTVPAPEMERGGCCEREHR